MEQKFYIKNNDNDVIDLCQLSNENKHTSNDLNENNKLSDPEYSKYVDEMFKNRVACSSVGFKNSIKLIFNENNKLLNDERRKNFKIFILDENDNNIEETILKKWINNEEIHSGTAISSIKKLFLLNSDKYDNNKPFELSMYFNLLERHTKIKIKITFDNLSTYAIFNNSEVIDLTKLEKGNKKY